MGSTVIQGQRCEVITNSETSPPISTDTRFENLGQLI